MHTVRIATNPRKWRRPAPCPACRQSQPLILTLGAIYKLRTRKPVNTIYGCICPNCRHKCILHVDGKNLNKAIRLWNHHASACGQVRRLAVLRRGRRIHGMRRHPDRHEASGLHRLLDERQAGRPVLRLGQCERRGQGAGKMSYNVVTTEGIRTFENIDDAGDYAQAMSLRTGEPAKVFHAETGLVAFTVRPTTKDTK